MPDSSNHPKNYTHNHSHNHQGNSNLWLAFVINSIFVIIEIVGGIFTNSSAILSDAVHDFGDSLSLGISIFLQKSSKKKVMKNLLTDIEV